MSLFQTPIPNPTPLVSAIVLNYRSPRDAIRCIEALKSQTIADRLEVLVVDNHSEDESVGWLRARYTSDPMVRLIEERKNVGYGRGNNTALAFAKGEYVLIINPDNTLPRNGLERMLESLQNHTDAAIVGPALLYQDGGIRPSARQFPSIIDLFRKRFFPQTWQKNYEQWLETVKDKNEVEVDWLVGACLLMRTELLKSLGGFDPRYFLFFEDIDLCRRVHLLGKKVLYLPSIHVLDRRDRLSGSTVFSLLGRKMTWVHLVSAVRYFRKWSA